MAGSAAVRDAGDRELAAPSHDQLYLGLRAVAPQARRGTGSGGSRLAASSPWLRPGVRSPRGRHVPQQPAARASLRVGARARPPVTAAARSLAGWATATPGPDHSVPSRVDRSGCPAPPRRSANTAAPQRQVVSLATARCSQALAAGAPGNGDGRACREPAAPQRGARNQSATPPARGLGSSPAAGQALWHHGARPHLLEGPAGRCLRARPPTTRRASGGRARIEERADDRAQRHDSESHTRRRSHRAENQSPSPLSLSLVATASAPPRAPHPTIRRPPSPTCGTHLVPQLEHYADEHRLGRRLERLRRSGPDDPALGRSSARCEGRGHGRPPPRRGPRSPTRPSYQCAEDLLAAIRDHQVGWAGETGSGRTTQLPKLCLELGRGVRGAIAHTQPAAGRARQSSPTDQHQQAELLAGRGGRLRRALQQPPREDTLLRVITDSLCWGRPARPAAATTRRSSEAHERSLNIDFLLGYLARILRSGARPEAGDRLGDDQIRALRGALPAARPSCARHRVPGRGALPAAEAGRKGRGRTTTPSLRPRRGGGRRRRGAGEAPATSSCSSSGERDPATPPTRSPAGSPGH